MTPGSRQARILIFAKAPVPGRVKTRLIPALGAEGAARLAAEMLERTAREALESHVGAVELCADPSPDDPQWAGHWPQGVELTAQGEGDLGERLARAARRVLDGGEKVILIGTDSSDLDRVHLREAASALEGFDAVIHPTLDGGYALLALARFDASLFAEIPWSTDAVARTTVERIRPLGWSLRVGAPLRDIDEPADLL